METTTIKPIEILSVCSYPVFVCYMNFGYDGMSEPEAVFGSREDADAFVAKQPTPYDWEVKELILEREITPPA